MYKDKKILAVIGARSGSQGLKDKNIHLCAGKELICWTIEAAKGSKYIDRVVVSTDSEVYAKIARKAGAEVPFLRPAEISDGSAPIGSFLKHAVDWFRKNENQEFDYIISLPPTSPLRKAHHIDEAIENFLSSPPSDEMTLVSVYKAPHYVGWLLQVDSENHLKFCLDQTSTQRQKLKEYYLPNGAIKISSSKNIGDDFYGKKTLPYQMSLMESVDIDSMEDLINAEKYLQRCKDEQTLSS